MIQLKSCWVGFKQQSLTSLSEQLYNPIEKDKYDTPNTKIHDHSLSWLGTDTSIKIAGYTSCMGGNHPS